jgi:predicted  nucleic acid-binding Zn-ribbon protein
MIEARDLRDAVDKALFRLEQLRKARGEIVAKGLASADLDAAVATIEKQVAALDERYIRKQVDAVAELTAGEREQLIKDMAALDPRSLEQRAGRALLLKAWTRTAASRRAEAALRQRPDVHGTA